MKLNAGAMMTAAMLVGSLWVTGCAKANDADAGPVAPEENPAAAPVVDSAKPGIEQDERRVHYYAPHAPPAARYERVGRAPSERHFWVPGYHRWTGREYAWYPGRWYERRAGYEYMPGHWENRWGRWEYIPGYWARRY